MAILKRIASVLTIAALAVNTAVFCFAQSYNTIKITSQSTVSVTHGNEVTYTEINGTYTRGDKTYNEKAYTVAFTQSDFAKIDVTSGSSLFGRKTLSALTSQYTAPDGYRTVAAINGDFFSAATGLALGVEVSNGVLKSSNNYEYDKVNGRWTLGFKEDGTAVIGQPNLTVNVTVGDTTVTPSRVNSRPDNNFVILTEDYGAKTHWNTAYAYDVIELKSASALAIGKATDIEYVAYYSGLTEPLDIKAGHFYLIAISSDKSGDAYKSFSRLKAAIDTALQGKESVTGRIAVTDSTGGTWASVVTAISGGNLLINDGVMRYPSTYDSSISNTLTSRTAVGIKKDGSVIFYCVEKSSNGNSGVPIEAVTQALYDIGCVYAINFDGGGSTTISAAERGGALGIKNTPQDGAQRAVANCIMIIARDYPPEILTDFEEEPQVTAEFEGNDLLKITQDNEVYHMGDASLRLDYKLSGFTSTVEFYFNSPYDVSKYDNVTMWLGAKSSNTPIIAILEKDGKWEYTKVADLDFDGFERFTIDTAGATKLIGFKLNYEIASDNSGVAYIDRIVGYRNDVLEDSVAPTLSVTVNGTGVTAVATDDEYPTISDTVGYEFYMDGLKAEHTLANGTATADTSTLTGNKIVKGVTDAYDLVGNRARQFSLLRTADYSKEVPFADVTVGKWDELYILYCEQSGIINGIAESNKLYFKGTNTITRAEFCTMLVRQAGLNIEDYADTVLPYEDVNTLPVWALPYIKAAYAEGIMQGTGTFTGVAFNARANITRQEAACAIDRINDDDLRLAMKVAYGDTDTVSGWAAEAVSSLSKQGIMGGDSDGRFYPKRTLTRSEAAAILTRI